jgi:hypothetical protein
MQIFLLGKFILTAIQSQYAVKPMDIRYGARIVESKLAGGTTSQKRSPPGTKGLRLE